MKTGKLKKYIRCAIFVAIGCYILAVIISIAMMSQMTQITYNATAYGTTLREDIVDFKTRQRDKTKGQGPVCCREIWYDINEVIVYAKSLSSCLQMVKLTLKFH